MRRQRILVLAVFTTGVLAWPAFTVAAGKHVGYLLYYNNGDYSIDYVELNWEDEEGNPGHQRWDKDLTPGMAFCLSLRDHGKVLEGSEVWLEVKIAGGDKASCRKSRGLIYKESSLRPEFFRSDGLTLGSHFHCKKRRAPTSIVGASSGNCAYKKTF